MSNKDYVYEKYNVVDVGTQKPTSYIFKTFTQHEYPGVYEKAIQIQNFFGVNKTVYGIKKHNNKFTFEFYYYYPKENPLNTLTNICKFLKLPISDDIVENKDYSMVSFDIDPNNTDIIRDLNVYYTLNDCDHNSSYNHHSHPVCTICKMVRSVTYSVDTGITTDKNVYKNFFKNEPHVERDIFEYTRSLLQQDVDMNLLFPKYLMNFKKSVCVSSKPGGTIGLYFNLIPFEDFITFLHETKFSKTLERELTNESSNLLFDIGIDIRVIDYNNIEINKIAFYGIL
jgi:hypothetical protein